jgi:hypothetical protein
MIALFPTKAISIIAGIFSIPSLLSAGKELTLALPNLQYSSSKLVANLNFPAVSSLCDAASRWALRESPALPFRSVQHSDAVDSQRKELLLRMAHPPNLGEY